MMLSLPLATGVVVLLWLLLLLGVSVRHTSCFWKKNYEMMILYVLQMLWNIERI